MAVFNIYKSKISKQERILTADSISIQSNSKENSLLFSMQIIHNSNKQRLLKTIDNMKSDGGSWRSGSFSSQKIGDQSAHTVPYNNKVVQSDISFFTLEGACLIILNCSKFPISNPSLKSIQRMAFTSSEIKKFETLLLSTLEKLRQDGMTR